MSYLAEVPCVQYAWTIAEEWSRTVTETYTDSQGHTQTRTRHESGWTNVTALTQSATVVAGDTEELWFGNAPSNAGRTDENSRAAENFAIG